MLPLGYVSAMHVEASHQDTRERTLAVQSADSELEVALLQTPHGDCYVLDQVRPSEQIYHRPILRMWHDMLRISHSRSHSLELSDR